ncbi:hypothetical protein IW261DRAFT_1495996 [Armillaria novae-zelandiae]|uniref:Secreted protein n=1 Tax=Armillaria novae-zelandiae TaxID=153914 RepID=A0AA39P0A9_9AGAR|nr:hypothetical protein IW261DRAFT_1495996 [Armillaria novae-zelandiae]
MMIITLVVVFFCATEGCGRSQKGKRRPLRREMMVVAVSETRRNCHPVKGSFLVIADFQSRKSCTFDGKDNEMGCVETQGCGENFWKFTLGNEDCASRTVAGN